MGRWDGNECIWFDNNRLDIPVDVEADAALVEVLDGILSVKEN